jgi:hypothetical protein
MAMLRVKLILTVASMALMLLCASVLYITTRETWDFAEFSLWCAVVAPLSVVLGHLFRIDLARSVNGEWRAVCAGLIGMIVVLVIAEELTDAKPELGMIALSGNLILLVLFQEPVEDWFRSAANKSSKRMREK